MPPPCKFQNTPGGCRRSDCPFEHDQSMNTSNDQICRFFQQGNCRAGSSCRFSHALTTSGFGQSTPGLGQFAFSQQTSTFGQSSPFQAQIQSAFGQTSKLGALNPFQAGYGQNSSMSAFGSSAFGQSTAQSSSFTSVFGRQQPQTAGTNRFSVLGGSSAGNNQFPNPSTPAPFQSSLPNNPFQSSVLTSTSTNSSYQPPNPNPFHTMSNSFQSSPAPNAFGSSALMSNAFHAANQSQQNDFTQSTPTAQQTQTNVFGQPSGKSSFLFGNSSSGASSPFNSSSQQPAFGHFQSAQSPVSQFTANQQQPVSLQTSPFGSQPQLEQSQPQSQMQTKPSVTPRISGAGFITESAAPQPAPSVTTFRGIYSLESALSVSDKAEYAAPAFTRIPFMPPAQSMI